MDDILSAAFSILAYTLRIGPMLLFAPPFNMMRIPASIRVVIALGISFYIFGQFTPEPRQLLEAGQGVIPIIISELILGIIFMLSFQITFAAILMIGRAVDIQTGFGLALLLDPANKGQRPLIGTVFAYAAAILFFSMDAPFELLAILQSSYELIPLGWYSGDINMGAMLSFISMAFVMATGLAGVIFLVLLLLDITVAFISRTLPQMNVLLIGFQVKTLAVLFVLPFAIIYSVAIYIKLIKASLMAIPSIVGF